jgi:phospholipase/carboxylesterase
MFAEFLSLMPEGSKIIPATQLEKRVCIGLHGFGDNATNFSELAREIGHKFTTYVCLNGLNAAPFPAGRQWFSLHQNYYPELVAAKNLIRTCTEKILSAGGVSSNKSMHSNISLLGFSQGSALSLAAALESEFGFESVFALAGFLPFRHQLKISNRAKQHTRFYVSHGTQDNVVYTMHHFETIDFMKQIEVLNVESALYPIAHTLNAQQILRVAQMLEEK